MGYPDWQTYNALATLIAQALQSAGIPVLGNPIPLYNIVASTGTGQPALVGATVDGAAWTPSVTHAQAMANFDSYVNGNPCTKAAKAFINPPGYPTAIPQSDQDLINAGAEIYLSVKPNITTSPAEDAALTACLQMYKNAGAKLRPILWHEPQAHFPSLDQWGPYWAHYQPIIAALGLPVVYDSSSQGGESAVGTWWPAPNPDHALQDLYWNDWQFQGVTLGTLVAKAIANNVPVGVGEWNIDSNSQKTPTPTQWNNWVNMLISTFTDVMTGGNDLSAIMYYMGAKAPSQPNNLLLSSSDWKVAGWNQIQAALSVSPASSGVTIQPGHTTTLTPITPSPQAGYAIANGQSYDLVLILTTSAGSTVPFASLELDWYNSDVVHAPLFHSQRWQVPCGQAGSGGAIITGHGPQLAAYMGVKVTNRDSVPITVQFQLNSTGRQTSRHDLRFDVATGPGIPTYTLAGGQGYGLSLGEVDTATINPTNSKAWLMSMFAGQAYLRVVVNGAAGVKTVHVTAAPQPPSRWGNTNLQSQYLPLSAANGDNDQSWFMALPRGPVQVTVTNSDANPVTVSLEMVAIEPG